MAATHEQSASAQANADSYGKLVYIIGYIILGIGAIYGDVMFVTLLGGALPSGPLGIAAIIGAFLTSASLIALVIGKSFQFRPGDQITWAWLFTWVEIGVMALNVILSALHGMHVDPGYLESWLYICPATPFVAVVGWIMLIYADPRRHHLHEDMAMNDELIDGQRRHKHNVHKVRLELQNSALEQQRVYMEQYMQTPEVQAALKHGSQQIALGIVSEIIQRPIMPQALATPAPVPQLPNAQTIDTTAQKIDTAPQPAVRQPARPRFIPPTPARPAQKKEDEKITPPLAQAPAKKPLPVMRKGGTYVVNKPAKIHLND